MEGRRPAVRPRDQGGVAVGLALLGSWHQQSYVGFDEGVIGIVGVVAFIGLGHIPQQVHAVQPVLDDDIGVSGEGLQIDGKGFARGELRQVHTVWQGVEITVVALEAAVVGAPLLQRHGPLQVFHGSVAQGLSLMQARGHAAEHGGID